MYAQKKAGKSGWSAAEENGSPRIEIAVRRGVLNVWRGREALPPAVRRMFDPHDGTLTNQATPEEAVAALEKLRAGDYSDLRLSQEVLPWLEERCGTETVAP
jgi:hypothetical protein